MAERLTELRDAEIKQIMEKDPDNKQPKIRKFVQDVSTR
jgi:hypothetical protein